MDCQNRRRPHSALVESWLEGVAKLTKKNLSPPWKNPRWDVLHFCVNTIVTLNVYVYSDLTVQDLEKFVPELLEALFVEMLVHGNMSEQVGLFVIIIRVFQIVIFVIVLIWLFSIANSLSKFRTSEFVKTIWNVSGRRQPWECLATWGSRLSTRVLKLKLIYHNSSNVLSQNIVWI